MLVRKRFVVLACSLLASVVVGRVVVADSGEQDAIVQFSIFVDPRIPSSAMPPAPNVVDRSKILEVLGGTPQVCGSSLLSNAESDPLPKMIARLRGLGLQSALVPSLGHIILTESTLNGLPFLHAVSALVQVAQPGDRTAQNVILNVDQLAPIIAERLLGQTGDRPRGLRDLRGRLEIEGMLEVAVDADALRGQTHNIRSSLEDGAAHSKNVALSQALAEAKAARSK